MAQEDELNKLLQSDKRREKKAVQAIKRFLKNNGGDLALLWHWGDGDGAYVIDMMRKHVRELGS